MVISLIELKETTFGIRSFYICMIYLFIYLFILFLRDFIFFLFERESTHISRGNRGEREGEVSAGSLIQGSIPGPIPGHRDHDLSGRQTPK